jgi:hypothetical protein
LQLFLRFLQGSHTVVARRWVGGFSERLVDGIVVSGVTVGGGSLDIAVGAIFSPYCALTTSHIYFEAFDVKCN